MSDGISAWMDEIDEYVELCRHYHVPVQFTGSRVADAGGAHHKVLLERRRAELERRVSASKTCEHRLGHYRWSPSGSDRGDDARCGKPAKFVCQRPSRPNFYLCAKHAKTRVNPVPL